MTPTQDWARLLDDLCTRHSIAPVPRLEWSRRMTATLGRAFPGQDLIRLSAWLSDAQTQDTLRHELAHIAAARDSRGRPHGPAWRRWAALLGADTRSSAPSPPERAPQESPATPYWGLECPRCGVRLSRRRVLPGLYHRGCGPRRGKLKKVLRTSHSEVLAWVALVA